MSEYRMLWVKYSILLWHSYGTLIKQFIVSNEEGRLAVVTRADPSHSHTSLFGPKCLKCIIKAQKRGIYEENMPKKIGEDSEHRNYLESLNHSLFLHLSKAILPAGRDHLVR